METGPTKPRGYAGRGTRVDVLLVGGGLANSLIAWRLAQVRPELRVLLVERNGRLGGARTWCSPLGAIPPGSRPWLEPLIAHVWRSHAVRYPRYTRVLPGGCLALNGDRVHDWVTALAGPAAFRFGCIATEVHARGARIDGERVHADVVIDGRGWPGPRGLHVRYRRYAALELELHSAHGLTRPLQVDATVPQVDDFRFVQVLPVGTRRLRLEASAFDDADDRPEEVARELREVAAAYASAQGWRVAAVVGDDAGLAPVALGGDVQRFLGPRDGVARVGLRAALFHPSSGLTVPDAVRIAADIAADPLDDGRRLAARLRAAAIATWRRRAFFRLLNRLLLQVAPDQRYRAMQRFHRLDASLVERFQAADLHYRDRLRLLTGRAPVSLATALAWLAVRRTA